MNSTQTTLTANTINTTITTTTRLAGAGLAATLTLAMLLGVNTLAQVDAAGAQMAKSTAQPVAASAARS